MRKALYTILLAAAALAAKAQTVSTFESQPLSGADTYYVNYAMPGQDVGFTDGMAYFPAEFDSSGGVWFNTGFVYSNVSDTASLGYLQQFAARPGMGANGSSKYVVTYFSPFSMQPGNFISLRDSARGRAAAGCYLTNNTYAYGSMRDGDGYAKKFGGTSGNDSDYFRVLFFGWHNGQRTADSVVFYLADFRDADNANDYIVDDWVWTDLSGLGAVDSITYTMESSDTNSFGIKTPTYFAMDDFTSSYSPTAVQHVQALAAKVYPVPASDVLFVETANSGDVNGYEIYSVTGARIVNGLLTQNKEGVSIANLPAGMYQLRLTGSKSYQTITFQKR